MLDLRVGWLGLAVIWLGVGLLLLLIGFTMVLFGLQTNWYHALHLSLPFARGCRVGVWFGFVGAALLPAFGTCAVLAFGAMPGRCYGGVTLHRTVCLQVCSC